MYVYKRYWYIKGYTYNNVLVCQHALDIFAMGIVIYNQGNGYL